MANFGKLQLTNDGIRLQALAEGGTPLKAKRMALGSGLYSGSILDLKALVTEVVSVSINRATLLEDNKSFLFEGYFKNSDLLIGFEWRELGLFMQDPENPEKEVLYCYSNAGNSSDYIPPNTDEKYDKYLSIQVGFSNAQNVTITAPDSLLLVGREEFEIYKNNAQTTFNEHVESFNQYKSSNNLEVSTNKKTMNDHIANKQNPHAVTKSQVGLGNVDNTSDLEKPISQATQTALDSKLDKKSGGQVNGNVDFYGNVRIFKGLFKSNGALTPTFGIDGLQVINNKTNVTNGANQAAVPIAGEYFHILRMNFQNNKGYFVELALPIYYTATNAEALNMYYRVIASGEEKVTWRKLIDSDNYKNYLQSNFEVEIISNGKDLNTVTSPGFYRVGSNSNAQTLINSPTTNAFFMIVGYHAGNYQEIIEYTTSNPKRFMRNYYNATWGRWYRIYTEADNPYSLQIQNIESELETKMDKVAVYNADGTSVVKQIDLGFKMLEEEGNVTKGQLIDRGTKGVLYPETTTERVIGLDKEIGKINESIDEIKKANFANVYYGTADPSEEVIQQMKDGDIYIKYS